MDAPVLGASGRAEATRPAPRVPVGELVFALLMLGLGVFALVGAFTIHVPVGVKVGPTVFPIFVSIVLLGSAAAVLVSVLRGNRAEVEEGEDIVRALRWEDWLVIDHRGWPLGFHEMPPMRALSRGRIVESTLLGLYNRSQRQLHWLSVTVVPQFAADADRPHQVLSLFSDVTELKRDSALFDRVQALAHIGGWEWDCTTDSLYLTDESVRILATEIVPIEMVRERLAKSVAIRLSMPPHGRATFERLLELLAQHKGDRKVAFVILEQDRHLRVTADVSGIRVRPSERLVSEVEKICGSGSVSLR